MYSPTPIIILTVYSKIIDTTANDLSHRIRPTTSAQPHGLLLHLDDLIHRIRPTTSAQSRDLILQGVQAILPTLKSELAKCKAVVPCTPPLPPSTSSTTTTTIPPHTTEHISPSTIPTVNVKREFALDFYNFFSFILGIVSSTFTCVCYMCGRKIKFSCKLRQTANKRKEEANATHVNLPPLDNQPPTATKANDDVRIRIFDSTEDLNDPKPFPKRSFSTFFK